MSDDFSESLTIEETNRDSLPHEILIDIVLRLPIKSIITWTSVSKSWNSLIKNPNFISTHLNHNHTRLLLLWKLVKDYKGKFENEAYSLHWNNEALDEYKIFYTRLHVRGLKGVSNVVGTCNGLVCLADGYNFFVWNPCIRKYAALPPPNVTSISTGVGVVTSTTCYGFGFDSKTNDYKVVTVVDKENGGEVHVYSLATGKWKMLAAVPPRFALCNNRPQAFVNGSLHWFAFRSTNDGYHSFVTFVLVFDLGDDDFREIMLPNDLPFSCGLSVSVCGESLALFRRVQADDPCIRVWVMKEYGVFESWTKVLIVGPQGPGVEVPMIYDDFSIDQENELYEVMSCMKRGEVVIEMGEGKLLSIDTESKKIKHLWIPGQEFTFVHTYMESLVLLDKSEDAVSY